MGRAPCCDEDGLKKGPWMAEEDQKLIDYIQKHGAGNWRTLPKNAGLRRCGKSCRLRWINYLRPDIKRGRFTGEEEETMIQMHAILGNKWSAIASRLPGRTDNEIKNYWNTRIRKRLLRMGIDPITHAPRLDLLNISSILQRQTLVSPEILGLASFLSSQQRNQNYVFQDQHPWMQSEVHGGQACNGEDEYSYDDSYYLVPEPGHLLNPVSESSYPTVLSSTPSSSISTPIHYGVGGEEERESYSTQYLLNDESIAELLNRDSSWNDIQQLLDGQAEFPALLG